jgi:hypothetical protein
MPCERQQNASAESRRISETAVFIGDFADLSNYLRTEENADKHFSISNPEGQASLENRREDLVRSSGFEPPRYRYRQPLKLVRLPVPPRPREGNPKRLIR